jgi:four helix bundle protein
MRNDELKDLRVRTKDLALRIIRLYAAIARGGAAEVIGKQLLRCGTSVGAQYREACRSRSTAEFISKMESATQELDETCYWLELLIESSLIEKQKLEPLAKEVNELMAIFVTSCKTAKSGRRK